MKLHRLNRIQDHAIAYNAWADSLHKSGAHPKNKNGSSMDVAESFQYFIKYVDTKKWLMYAVKMRQPALKRKS